MKTEMENSVNDNSLNHFVFWESNFEKFSFYFFIHSYEVDGETIAKILSDIAISFNVKAELIHTHIQTQTDKTVQ